MNDKPLISIKGIGPRRAELFGKLGLFSLIDLIRYYPRDYLDYSKALPIAQLRHGDNAVIMARISESTRSARVRGGLSIVTARAEDETGAVELKWYNQPYVKNRIPAGKIAYIYGRIDLSRGKQMLNPAFSDSIPGILPIYPITHGLSQKQLREAVCLALSDLEKEITETLPTRFREYYGLADLIFSLNNIHFPTDMRALSLAKKRLAFEDMLLFSIIMRRLLSNRLGAKGIKFHTQGAKAEFIGRLPFAPTVAQLRVMDEILADMGAQTPANRLIQGDVGSGKTILALFAMHVAARSGYQAVLMAPTEILAHQHYATLQRFFGDKACLICGGMKKSERMGVYERINDGRATAVVGTHALLQEGLRFQKLGLVVTDEQHRFGVKQRAAISLKGETPDVFLMSATPIPRTLALLLYGDLDISVLNQLPPGRKPIKTYIVPASRRSDMYGFVERQAALGRRSYIVCPLLSGSDAAEGRTATDVYNQLKRDLSIPVGLVHGRMSGQRKNEVISAFRDGEIMALVSTTVIEVGVDVPLATIMIIENADRFGLAQLHQLRGRVGRGTQESFCFLISETENENSIERLRVLAQSSDGFEIAQKDLELRGPGELLGHRQHGLDGFSFARLNSDMATLKEAQDAANQLINDPDWHAEAEEITEQARLAMARLSKNVAPN